MVIRAVEMAAWQRQGKDPVILLSDRGSQFTGSEFTTGVIALRTRRELTYLITSSDSIIPGCDVELPFRIRNCPPF